MRAVAVCLVLASHLKINIAHHTLIGGYIGVDIFFVISGYLISSILLREMQQDRFSIAAFYERRIRRIVPALMGMLVFTTIVAWRQFFPIDLMDYMRSMISAILSVANIYFWSQAGYFDVSAPRRPLLHTWSLGVEEQFYLLFPILLILIFRYARRWLKHAIVAMALISFAISAVLVFKSPALTFYQAPTRAWELLTGTMVAMLGTVQMPRVWRQIAGVSGLLTILAVAFLYTDQTPFPGATALLPCGATALLMISGNSRDGLAYRILSSKPMVFIGLISYSLYLWHWPLISLRNYGFIEPFSLSPAGTKLLIVAESFVAAILSWRFIETPFRKGFGISRKPLFAYAALASSIMVLVGVFTIVQRGVPNRFDPETARIASYTLYGGDHVAYRSKHCFIAPEDVGTFEQIFDPQMCVPQSTKPTYLITGSSLAAHLWIGLSQTFPNINWQQITAGACRPTLDPAPVKEVPSCVQMRSFLFQKYLPSHTVDGVVLSSGWVPQQDTAALGKTLDYLAARHMKAIVVGPMIEYDVPLPLLLAGERRDGKAPGSSLAAHINPHWYANDATMRQFVEKYPGVTYISMADILCPGRVCTYYTKDHTPVMSDKIHLTPAGSEMVAERLKQSGFFKPLERVEGAKSPSLPTGE